MILVTGATGNVGTEVVAQLTRAGHRARTLVRNPKDAGESKAELAIGDLGDPASLDAAMRGIERLYLLAPFTPALQQHEANAIDAAKRAGIKHVVKHSVLGAAYEAVTLSRWHRAGEKLLEASGLVWTHIRPSGFFPNALAWAGSIKAQGTVYYPTGNGKLGVIDPRDIAAVAVKSLTEPGHEGKAYDLTGPEALTTGDQVAAIGRAIDRPLTYVDVPDAAARDSMLGMGMPAVMVDILLEFTGLVRAGHTALVTDVVERLTGARPRTFEAWAREHAAAFR